MVMPAKVLLKMFPCHRAMKSRIVRAGLISQLLILSACQAALSPGQVTLAFWEAMAQGNIESARKYATKDTQQLVIKQGYLEGASIKTEEAVIDGPNASVLTILTLKKPVGKEPLSFNTVLLKENDLWKVDYQQTLNNISILPFGELFKSLRGIGEAINKQLEQQIPLLDKQIKSFGEELIRQMEEFRRDLENSVPPEKKTPQPGSI
jgi:hypothetical protein